MKDLLKDYNHKYSKVIIFAMERCGDMSLDLKTTINHLDSVYSDVDYEDVLKAINYGSMGKYGITEDLQCFTFGYWIMSYLNEN